MTNQEISAEACEGRVSAARQVLPIHDESGPLGDPVVQAHRGLVRLVRVPVDTTRAALPGSLVHRLDQRTAHALPAHGRSGEEVLQVAGRPDETRAPMEEVVHQADELAVHLGHKRVNGLARVEEAPPRRIRGRAGDAALVELVVAAPERVPVFAITARDRAHDDPRRASACGAQRTAAVASARSSIRMASSFTKSIDVAVSRKPSASSARVTCSSYERTGTVTGRSAGSVATEARSRSRARSTSPSRVRTFTTWGWRSRPSNANAKARVARSSPSISAAARRIASGLPPMRCGGS